MHTCWKSAANWSSPPGCILSCTIADAAVGAFPCWSAPTVGAVVGESGTGGAAGGTDKGGAPAALGDGEAPGGGGLD